MLISPTWAFILRSEIYTTNWIGRLNRNYNRILNMSAVIPDSDSILFLLGRASIRKQLLTEKTYPWTMGKIGPSGQKTIPDEVCLPKFHPPTVLKKLEIS